MSRKNSAVLVAALAVMMTAACSTGGGGLGDIFGGGGQSSNYGELRGRVDYVDFSSNYVVLTNVSGGGSMLSNSGGNTVRVYYDTNTPVSFNGQSYRPADLERGDEVSVQVDQSGNNLYARSMTVLHDATPGGSTSSGGGMYNDSVVRGTVRYIDSSRRTIEVDRFNGGSSIVTFDNNTYVTFNGRNYRVTDLERGDEVEIRVNDLGSGRLSARDIVVTRSVSSGSGNSGTWGNDNRNYGSTIRGTVRYVDTSRREIGLESANWISGFNSGAGSGMGSSIVVRYDTNTNVEINGQLYSPNGLERGDVIEVQVQDSGSSSTYFANRIVLVRNVRQ